MDEAMEIVDELEEKVYFSDSRDHKIVYINRRLKEYLGSEEYVEYMEKPEEKLLNDHPGILSCHIDELVNLEWFIGIGEDGSKHLWENHADVPETCEADCERKYQMNIVFDARDVEEKEPFDYYRKGAKIISECLNRGSSMEDPETSIQYLLELFGKTFGCDRSYIFEIDDQFVHNTYEWCDHGVACQQHILQKLREEDIRWWMQCIEKEKQVIIKNLDDIRTVSPIAYSFLKPQCIESLAVAALMRGDRMIGFWGVDNPSYDSIERFVPLLKIVGSFLCSLIRYRNYQKELQESRYRDSLTGAYNRAALFEFFKSAHHIKTAAVIYCDIVQLKKNNGMTGSVAGDKRICECYRFICNELNSDRVYRVSGDEFAVLFTNVSEDAFMRQVSYLKNRIQDEQMNIVIGHTWTDQAPVDPDRILSSAEREMFDEVYGNYVRDKGTIPAEQEDVNELSDAEFVEKEDVFYSFLKKSHFDLELLFRSMVKENTTSYFYFGDLQKNVFYISDNLRDDFGFQSNIVPRFLTAWEYRITSYNAKEMYRKDHEMMLKEKRNVHSLRYRVRDITGKSMWIRCYGIMTWNEDRTQPLFFSGRITHQDAEFVVDPVTSFPNTSVMLKKLKSVSEDGGEVRTIGFSFNNITEINNTKGRSYSDYMMRMIAEELINSLSSKMTFYRLNGMRVVAVLENSCTDSIDDLVETIRDIISKWYKTMGVSVHQTCSFGVMVYRKDLFSPEDYLEQIVALIKLAKHEGILKYEEDTGDNVTKVKRMSGLALALNRDVLSGMKNFRVVIQPVMSGSGDRVVGGEALLRWNCDGEEISPSVFIPILEKMNMIQIVGRWVFEQTVSLCRRLCAYRHEFHLAFNVSMQQISDEGFAAYMKEILEKYQMNGSRLIVEMTEDFMDEHPEKLYEFVEACKNMGMKIALDDFGNGYSSLRRLLQYPSGIIKLDKSLLREMMESDAKKNFIASIVYACHRFGKRVCMEGVETREQNEMIKDAGCDMIQGFYYYYPLEIEEILQLVATL